MFLSWSTLMQQSLDSLQAETLRARRDTFYLPGWPGSSLLLADTNSSLSFHTGWKLN
jgi:hypothetical protein